MLNFDVCNFFQPLVNAIGKLNTTRLYANQNRFRKIFVILDELKTKAVNSEVKFLAVEDDAGLQGWDDLRKDKKGKVRM